MTSRTPRILGIGGTARPGSTSRRALEAALDAARAAGATTLVLGAEDLLLPMYEPSSVHRDAAAKRLVQEAARCDGLIVSSPGYHGAVSGLLKNALDYLEDLRDSTPPYLEDRAVGCIAVAAGWQAAVGTLASLRVMVHALRGWPTPLGVAVNAAQPVFAEDGALLDDGLARQLRTVGEQVVEFALGHGRVAGG